MFFVATVSVAFWLTSGPPTIVLLLLTAKPMSPSLPVCAARRFASRVATVAVVPAACCGVLPKRLVRRTQVLAGTDAFIVVAGASALATLVNAVPQVPLENGVLSRSKCTSVPWLFTPTPLTPVANDAHGVIPSD